MKQILIITMASLALGLSACSTTPNSSADTSVTTAKTEAPEAAKTTVAETKKAEMKDKKKKKKKKAKKDSGEKKGLTQTYAATPEQVKTATLVAMKKVGFKIKDEDGMEFEGKRSRKVGLAVGSGGEKIRAVVVPMENGQTSVHVRTKKTLVGIVGQKNWDDEVMDLISESLGTPVVAKPLMTS